MEVPNFLDISCLETIKDSKILKVCKEIGLGLVIKNFGKRNFVSIFSDPWEYGHQRALTLNHHFHPNFVSKNLKKV